ncbi:MAG: Transcriptional regulator associated with utilization of aromatics, LysR family [uncultured Paraburkholderia sp.]|nr:MAG: Transcriptional regulator associated with utilization of aromatics, LysR family [uncultured Paraburkholderia sp.]CAH2944566.1 MAG: Transcriptional regulator associated with utilization of aromatics, LysR family [uncultured Paraburkholderia sp.]
MPKPCRAQTTRHVAAEAGPAARTASSASGKDLLNLTQLRAFRLVADMGSATHAAAALFRAQSAVTRSVQELETALGEPLFDRGPSGMLPTPVGRAVLQRCERIFAELEELVLWYSARQARRRPATEGALPAYLLNTRRLQLFVALARHRHMPSTAKTFGLSQPAVSMAIRVLESGSGLNLFHRSPRGILLTTEGETFLLHVRRALNELRHVPDDIAALRGKIQGSVTVGALPLGRTLILPRAIGRMSALHPGVRVVTDESAYDILVASLRAGDIDFILGALRDNDASSGLKSERLMSEDIVLLVRSDHPLMQARNLTIMDLRDVQWILPRSNAPARALFEAQFKRMKLKPPMPTVETADLAVIRGLLVCTDMVAALSAQQLHYEVQSGQLAALGVQLHNSRREIGLTMRAAGTPSPAARALIDAIRLSVVDVTRTVSIAAV